MSTKKTRSSAVTIEDVALAAGVHVATVSRALREGGMVAPATREKVQAAARQLGYRPNVAAATLRTRRSSLVGVIVTDLGNPFFGPILKGLETELRKSGWMSLVVQPPEDAAGRRDVVLALADRQVGGLIIGAAEIDDPLLDTADSLQLPVVLVNRGYGERRFPSIVTDDRESMRLALDHLLALGHRHIAHIAGPRSSSTGRARAEAFGDLCRQQGIGDAIVVETPAFTRAAGNEAALPVLSAAAPPTAVVAGNDMLALGVLDAAEHCGLSVPGDLSIVGHNDMPLVDLIDPPLTTIRVPVEQLSREAARLLIERMRNTEEAVMMRVMMPSLVVRASTGPVRR